MLAKVDAHMVLEELEGDLLRKKEEANKKMAEFQQFQKTLKEEEIRKREERERAQKEKNERAFQEYIRRVEQRERERAEEQRRRQEEAEARQKEDEARKRSAMEALKRKEEARRVQLLQKMKLKAELEMKEAEELERKNKEHMEKQQRAFEEWQKRKAEAAKKNALQKSEAKLNITFQPLGMANSQLKSPGNEPKSLQVHCSTNRYNSNKRQSYKEVSFNSKLGLTCRREQHALEFRRAEEVQQQSHAHHLPKSYKGGE